ncbi:MshA, mannose-sensitive hemaglutinin [Vibrio nigripulchritudo ATCC 27043]|uniref:type II secretion system protein n=1 Tax=Vibrio nigripulchritudo TaxID=28173 RepID=UPI00021C3EBC|nr:type II secretion system protein [Vibrio nigripulchritudo]EGU56796.1 MshA, mannose-sensitive hemaglutinin [Vibrio nigripulchritudo ATCC 27043]
MKRQGGFTLIELVVVIVILGILAVTAAPKFLNLQGDARESSLQGLKGAMNGAAGIVYGKSAIEGEEGVSKGAATTPIASGIDTHFGYPSAETDGIQLAVEGLPADWDTAVSGAGSAGASYLATFKASPTHADATAIANTNCYVSYAEAENSSSAPTITVVSTGC